MIVGAGALLVIGKGRPEDQLLLQGFFLPQPIFLDGDSVHGDLMAHSKGWLVRCTRGSAGPTSINQDLFDFLHLLGSLPRETRGSVIV
jgi:hypothetical protein